MSRMFGWSLPPGCTQRMIDEQCESGPCAVCGKAVDDCICPECTVCGSIGDPACYKTHGMRYSRAQTIASEEAKLAQLQQQVQDQAMEIEMLKAWSAEDGTP